MKTFVKSICLAAVIAGACLVGAAAVILAKACEEKRKCCWAYEGDDEDEIGDEEEPCVTEETCDEE